MSQGLQNQLGTGRVTRPNRLTVGLGGLSKGHSTLATTAFKEDKQRWINCDVTRGNSVVYTNIACACKLVALRVKC